MPTAEPAAIVLDGASLTCSDVAAVGRRGAVIAIGRDGRERAASAAEFARRAAVARPVYGRTTGVGANRGLAVGPAEAAAHGLRLIRSHAGGGGPFIEADLSRAMLPVRANQIAAGGSGVDPGVLGVLANAVNLGCWPPVPVYGAIGTGDLTALAVTALCLLGERDWLPAGGAQPRFELAAPDALAFMSSNAATLAEAAIACHDLSVLLRASTVIAALSHVAVGGSAEPYAEAVQLARPHPGQRSVAATLRALLAGQPAGVTRIQDPYGYRALPQVHGAATDAAAHAELVVTVELNAAAENPLIDAAGQAVWHNGNFHTAYVGLALDAARAALFQTGALSAARLGTLMEPRLTALTPFLATDPEPSSGLMILEYVSHSAVADIRRLAAPAALGSAVLSLGVEEHAGFATQSARSATGVVAAYQVVLACELVAAVRALRLCGARPAAALLGAALDRVAAALPASTEDRPLDHDLEAAQELLPELAAVVAGMHR
jgi:histidine ammonia-lyase